MHKTNTTVLTLALLFTAVADARAAGWTQIGCSSASDGTPRWTQLNQNQGSASGTTWTKLDGGCTPPQAQAAAYHQPVQAYQPPAYVPPVYVPPYVPPVVVHAYQPPVVQRVAVYVPPVIHYQPPVIHYQPPPPPPPPPPVRRVCIHTFQDPGRCVWVTRSGAVAGWNAP